MALTKNVDFIKRIEDSVNRMMKDGKIDQYDIPEMVFLVTDLITTSSSSKEKVTIAQLEASINSLYDYIMTHYKLFPDEGEQKESFKRLFDMCVKLALYQPNVIKSCKSMFPCIA